MVLGKFERGVISDIVSNVVQAVRGVASVSNAPPGWLNRYGAGAGAGDQAGIMIVYGDKAAEMECM